MAAEFEEAPQSVIHTIEDLIQKYHHWLEDCRIACAIRKDTQTGDFEPAKTIKVTAAISAIVEYDVLIWVDRDSWELTSQAYREALIDHELNHISVNANGGYSLVKHDFGDFIDVIERHGLWNNQLKKSLKSISQPKLPGLEHIENVTIATPAGKVVTVSGEQLRTMAESV